MCGSISQRNVNRPRGGDLPKLLASRDSTRSSECQVSSLLFRALPCLRWCTSKCGLVVDQPSNGNTVDVNEGAAKTNKQTPPETSVTVLQLSHKTLGEHKENNDCLLKDSFGLVWLV